MVLAKKDYKKDLRNKLQQRSNESKKKDFKDWQKKAYEVKKDWWD